MSGLVGRTVARAVPALQHVDANESLERVLQYVDMYVREGGLAREDVGEGEGALQLDWPAEGKSGFSSVLGEFRLQVLLEAGQAQGYRNLVEHLSPSM